MIPPVNIDTDYLMTRIGRLSVQLEAAFTQRDQLLKVAQDEQARADAAEVRAAELQEILDSLVDDDEDDADEDDAQADFVTCV